MSQIQNFGQAQAVEVTVLVDNRADLIVKSTETVKRYTDEPLLAEHGFSALIDLKQAGIRILWDAGITALAFLENARRLQIDLATIDKIALSHGHGDHTAAVSDVLKVIGKPPPGRKWPADATMAEIEAWVQKRRVPLIAHPAAFRERWAIREDGTKYGPAHSPPRAEWEALGAQIVLSEGPYRLGPGCWTTGGVPRRSFERAGTRSRAYRQGGAFHRDHLEDDQALVINVEDKGLVIVAGCAHSGIVNTVRYAQEISGVEPVWAILGGFHLAPADDQEIQRTIEAIQAVRPALVAPSHCTGFEAISQFARHMPKQFVLGVVGARYLF